MTAEHLDNATVRSALVALINVLANSEIAHRESDFFAPLYDHMVELRSLFVEALVRASDPVEFVKGVSWQLGPIFASLGWLLTQHRKARSGPDRAAWLWLIERVPPRNRSELRRLRELAQHDPALQPVALNALLPARAPRHKPNPLRTPVRFGSEDTDHVQKSLEDRLSTAIDNVEKVGQARLDVADFIWTSEGEGSAMESIWGELTPETRARVDAFFSGRLEG